MRRLGCGVAILGLGIVAATADTAIPERNPFARECALRDAEAVAWIEERAEARAIAPALLAEATFTVLRARNACMHGKVIEALELYDRATR